MTLEKQYTIKLTEKEIEVAVTSMGEAPWNKVDPIIRSIMSQYRKQYMDEQQNLQTEQETLNDTQ